MRLIVKEYIAQLKEKDELDILLGDLFVQKGYIADNIPKTGNRQYGVDIQLHNKKELILLVIKQGNIDRNVWDGSVNAVRQSLDEIKDVAINSLTNEEKKKKIKIIVATNGKKDESIKLNWNNYVNNNKKWCGIPITIDFMGIDDIVKEVLDNYFNEYLFETEMHSLLRKALYFIDEGDYKRIYYEKIVDLILNKLKENVTNKKIFNKLCSTLYLASQMICRYADDVGNIKIAIEVSEYVIIRYWRFLLVENLFGKVHTILWLNKYCSSYELWNEKYMNKIKKIVNNEIILPNYNVVENRVLLYEVLGFLASYGNYLLNKDEERAIVVLNYIVGIINEYEYYAYTPYDISINVMIMIYNLLCRFNRFEEVNFLIDNQTEKMMNLYKFFNKFPSPSDTFEEAMEIEMNQGNIIYDTSAFWGYYLLIIYYMDNEEVYENLKNFLKTELSKVTKCVWFLRQQEENFLYDPWAMNLSGEGIEITIEDDFDLFKKKVSFIIQQYKNEKFSFDEFCFPGLEALVSHYYNYIPRVRFGNNE